MLTALTVFTIITGTASLLGFAFAFFGKVTAKYKWLCAAFFVLAAIWSGYVLLVPGSTTESNVASKIAYFHFPSVERQSETLLIQRGEFTLSGLGPIGIEFMLPFRHPPEFELINFSGVGPEEVPHVEKVTAHQVVIDRQYGFPQAEGQNRKFRWVARGIPL